MSSWLILLHFGEAFQPLYFTAHYFLYFAVPIIAWGFLVFLFNIAFSTPKIVYPLLIFFWFLNMSPSRYRIIYKSIHDFYPLSPFFTYGLLVHRVICLLIIPLVFILSAHLLDRQRNDLFMSKKGLLNLDGPNRSYVFLSSKFAKFFTTFKVGFSWQGIVTMILTAALPVFSGIMFRQMFVSSSDFEVVGRVARNAEVFLPLFMMLYALHFLHLETNLNLGELIASKSCGLKIVLEQKFLSLVTFSIVLGIVYYFGLAIGVPGASFLAFVKIVFPSLLFYLSLLFLLRALLKNEIVAFSLSLLVWILSLTFTDNFLSTFPVPVYY